MPICKRIQLKLGKEIETFYFHVFHTKMVIKLPKIKIFKESLHFVVQTELKNKCANLQVAAIKTGVGKEIGNFYFHVFHPKTVIKLPKIKISKLSNHFVVQTAPWKQCANL